MPRRGGFFSRIAGAVRRVFTGREEPPRRTPTPTPRPTPTGASRGDRDRQRARERDPYLATWDGRTGGTRGNFLGHRDFARDLTSYYDIPADEAEDFWDDYLRYMVGRRGERMPYRRDDIRNPFWQNWDINPDSFNWHEWREEMGYSHGARR
jgi:hypothetical protein